MRAQIIALFVFFAVGSVSAQQLTKHATPQLSPYVYCEIIANHLPTTGKPVLLDFGQKTNALSYNKLCDENGEKLKFNSGIEALNYMVSHDWEFVQAYTSGEENNMVHYLLRIPTAQLNEMWRQALIPTNGKELPSQEKK